MAGFVGKFADESGISLLYGYKLNGDRKKNLTRGSKKFSRHASEELSSAPEKLMGQAKFCAVHCTFLGSRFQEAIDFVTMRQVDRGH